MKKGDCAHLCSNTTTLSRFVSGRLHTSGNGATGEGMHSRPHANIVVLTTRARALLDAIDAKENRRLDEAVSDPHDVWLRCEAFSRRAHFLSSRKSTVRTDRSF